KNSATHLVLGKLKKNKKGQYSIEATKILFESEMLDRVSNPKFSLDQRSVFFTFKKNQTTAPAGENLVRIDLENGKAESLLADGFQNRFPTLDRDGMLYFVSDKTGVDNLYRWDGKTTQVTNFLTGMWLPAFGDQKAYGSVFTKDGWTLSSFKPATEID